MIVFLRTRLYISDISVAMSIQLMQLISTEFGRVQKHLHHYLWIEWSQSNGKKVKKVLLFIMIHDFSFKASYLCSLVVMQNVLTNKNILGLYSKVSVASLWLITWHAVCRWNDIDIIRCDTSLICQVTCYVCECSHFIIIEVPS